MVWSGVGRCGEERRGGHCGFMRVACGSHALRIRFARGLLVFPPGRRRFLCSFRALGPCCSPRIVLSPIMDFVGAFLSIQEPNLRKGVHETPCVTWPVRSDFDVLATHTFQIAGRTILDNPQEKTK